jgi:hypothetical protein
VSGSPATRAAAGIGIATTVIGTALVVAPARIGRLVSVDDVLGRRIIGLADLALVPGLIAGRPRWPWVGARAALNLVIGAYLLERGDGVRVRGAAAALAALTAGDTRLAVRLRRSADA